MQKFSNVLVLLIFFQWFSQEVHAQEIWLNLNPEYHFNNIHLRPEFHYRRDLSTGLETKIIKGNFLIKDFLIGMAYFHFPSGKNERRPYIGGYRRLKKWTFRNVLELRSFNHSTDQWRFRSKIDFHWNKNIQPTVEALYQFGQKDIFELRMGPSFLKKFPSHSVTLTPALIISQYTTPRYILMIGGNF